MNPNLERGLLLYQQSRHEQAETELRQALAAEPDHAYAHALLALCLAEREKFQEATSEAELLKLIGQLNSDPRLHGILVQAPLPTQIRQAAVYASVLPAK